ncbi:hypothetical protein M2135_002145 [Parabacteroides sp. PF5-9]|nr:hypothetical protein [Parabacteroides sp. PF5-9]
MEEYLKMQNIVTSAILAPLLARRGGPPLAGVERLCFKVKCLLLKYLQYSQPLHRCGAAVPLACSGKEQRMSTY